MNLPGNRPSESLTGPHAPLIDALFVERPPITNADFDLRARMLAKDVVWQPTKLPGLSVCLLEYRNGAHPRMTALAKLDSDSKGVSVPAAQLELLVQHGIIADDNSEYLHPYYLRQPQDLLRENQHVTLHPGSQTVPPSENQIEFYLATGQIPITDTERRCINLADNSLWLPGPVEHTEVMPLHMHNGASSMLVRWLASVTFRPRLDPLGEEVLVINGTLADELGAYPAGSWIRNPVASWQAWGGVAGTVIYYKNGHFGQATANAN